jgi:hypothetical protein
LLSLHISDLYQCFDEYFSLLLVLEHLAAADLLFGFVYLLYEDLRKFILLVVHALHKGLLLAVCKMLGFTVFMGAFLIVAGQLASFLED